MMLEKATGAIKKDRPLRAINKDNHPMVMNNIRYKIFKYIQCLIFQICVRIILLF